MARRRPSAFVCRVVSLLFSLSPVVRRELTEALNPYALVHVTRFVHREPARTAATASFASKLGLPGLAQWAFERLLSDQWSPELAARYLRAMRTVGTMDAYRRATHDVRRRATADDEVPTLLCELAAARATDNAFAEAVALAERALSGAPDLAEARSLIEWLAPCRVGLLGTGASSEPPVSADTIPAWTPRLGVLSCDRAGASPPEAAMRLLQKVADGSQAGARMPVLVVSRLCPHRTCPAARAEPFLLLADGAVFRDPLGVKRPLQLPAGVCPLFLSLHVDCADDLMPEDKAMLARHAPVGCRDWPTVYLLLNLGIDAYHASQRSDGTTANLTPDLIRMALEWASTNAPVAEPVIGQRKLCAPVAADARQRLNGVAAAESSRRALVPDAIPILEDQPSPGVIDIATSFDAGLLSVVPVMIESLVSSTPAPIRLFCLVRRVTARAQEGLRRRFPEVAFRFIAMDAVDYGGSFHFYGQLTISTMDRLMLPLVLSRFGRVAYLDSDLVVLDDLATMTQMETEPIGLAARPLAHPNWSPLHRRVELVASRSPDSATADAVRRELAALVDFEAPAFNAGVMLMDLGRLRGLGFSESTLDLSRRLGLFDNEALALWANGRFAPLPERWNYIPGIERLEAPAVIHWAGPRKPWRRGEHVPHREVWQRLARAAARR